MSQPTLFKFFARTPKSSTGSPNGGSSVKNEDTPPSTNGKHVNGGDTPKGNAAKPAVSSPRTPLSRNGSVGGTKRRRTEGEGGAPTDQSAPISRKKVKNAEMDSPSKDLTSGSLVWALLEGYPWWPSMIRGETKGGPYYKSKSMEYHVQFFDNPPTRAWVRKGDLKLYAGSTDADVPPAKTDKSWIEACKSADIAMTKTNEDRVKKYWHEFDINGNEDIGSGDDGSVTGDDDNSIKKMEVDDRESSRPKRGSEVSKKQKRIRTISSSSEEDWLGRKRQGKADDDEYCPVKNESIEESESSADEESDAGSEPVSENSSEDESPKKRKSKSIVRPKLGLTTPSTSVSGGICKSNARNRLQNLNVSITQSPSRAPDKSEHGVERDQTVWSHMTWSWAKDGNRQDNRKRKQSDLDYDPTTLFVPNDFLKTTTPGHRQWWDIKSKHFDTVIFFKVGKFYEFYHWDACTANKELGIIFMKGDYAHSGFPEISFSRFANVLVEKGYKIARVEQTETPETNAERIKNVKGLEKHEKIIRREVCQISTKGVRYASFQDDQISSPFSPESAYLYAIVEKEPSNPGEATIFGVCFIDTTIGTFHVGQFQDDRHASRLRTMFSHYVPAQILYERNRLSLNLVQLLNNMSSVRKDPLIPESQFWSAKKVLKYLSEQDFVNDGSGSPIWSPEFQTVLSENDALGLTPDENWELGVRCFGGVVGYLKFCLLDHDLLSQKRFEIYEPVDADNAFQDIPQRCRQQKYMVLDGITIRNLDIVDGPLSLLSTIDKCGTNFGKRLLRHWVCLPLAIPEEIAERQDAVEELMNIRECREKVIPILKGLPDLERLLSKIHYLGSAHRSKNHPDGRANFFEDIKYSKNKIADLQSTLKGFKASVKIIDQFKNYEDEITSRLLKQLVSSFPQLDELLTNFDNAFDHQLAAKEGKIKPKKGASDEYDAALQTIEEIEKEANFFLAKVTRELGSKVVYFGSDKKRFQIEVSDKVKVPRSFEMATSRKGFKRYYCNETKEFLSAILKAEVERDEILRDIARLIFEKFDKNRDTWLKAVECISNIDVLISLSLFSESQEMMCRPVIISSQRPCMDIVEGRHPSIPSDNYISNDTILGVENEGNFVILTGPNMGGKSTLMRQVGLLALLSHLGCYVPAEKCEMSVVDRIFTRLGANDNIGEGESTFFVEMSETSAILRHATPDSLLLIDELGRGTATYDGTAIAYAVAEELSKRNCRSLFSTHYHTLVEALEDNPAIKMSHMACMVENENEEDPTQESITFLYKMISGPCPKSYGFNAARLAGISDDVIRVAHKKAKELETSVAGIRSFTDMCSKIRQKTFSLNDFAALGI